MKTLHGICNSNNIWRLPVILCLLTAGSLGAPADEENPKAKREFSQAEWDFLRNSQQADAAELAAASKIAETFLRYCHSGRMKEALAFTDPAMFATTSRDEWTNGIKADVAQSGELKSCVLLVPRSLRTPPLSSSPDQSGGSRPPSLRPVIEQPRTVLTLLFRCEHANGASQAEVSLSGTGKAGSALRIIDCMQVPLVPGEWTGFEAALNFVLAVSLRATGAAEPEWRLLADAARRDAAICQLPLPAVPPLTRDRAKDKAAALVFFRDTLPREWKRKPPREGRPDPRLVILQMGAFHLAYEPRSPGNDDLLKRMRAVAGDDVFGSATRICESKLPANQGRIMAVGLLNRWSSMLSLASAFEAAFKEEVPSIDGMPEVKPPGDGK